MNIYTIEPSGRFKDNSYIYFAESISSDMFRFFVMNLPPDKIPQQIMAKAQAELTREDIEKNDYFECIFGAPIFSQKAVKIIETYINDDIDFYPINVEIQKYTYTLFIGRIKKNIPLIDYDKSSYRELSDGRKILKKAIYLKKTKEDFYIARDNKDTCYAVSEKFVELAVKEKLRMKFTILNPTP